MLKKVVAIAIVAGFATAAFAESPAPAPAAPSAKVTAITPAAADKKVEAPKATEPAKADAAKTATPAKAEMAKTEAPKDEAKPAKITKRHAKKVASADSKTEAATPAAK